MNEQKKVPTWLTIIILVLILASVVLFFIQTAAQSGAAGIIHGAIYFLAAAMAYMYNYFGYKKDSAKYFRLYALLSAVYCLYLPVVFFNDTELVINIINVFAGGIFLAFAIAQDLGKSLSYVLAAGELLCAIALMVLVPNSGMAFSIALANLFLALILCIMVYAKYVDKDNRKTV